jgi:hypothetical protein
MPGGVSRPSRPSRVRRTAADPAQHESGATARTADVRELPPATTGCARVAGGWCQTPPEAPPSHHLLRAGPGHCAGANSHLRPARTPTHHRHAPLAAHELPHPPPEVPARHPPPPLRRDLGEQWFAIDGKSSRITTQPTPSDQPWPSAAAGFVDTPEPPPGAPPVSTEFWWCHGTHELPRSRGWATRPRPSGRSW